jgi:hypothetical protein
MKRRGADEKDAETGSSKTSHKEEEDVLFVVEDGAKNGELSGPE